MRKIRVVYTLPNFNTAGSGKALLNIAKGLNKNLFEVHIVCENDKGDYFKVVESSGIPVHVFKYLPASRPIGTLIKETALVRKRWKEIAPDIVHSFHYSDNYTEGLAVRLAGSKWVFTKKNMSWGGGSGRGWKFRSALANAIAVQNTDMISQFYPDSNKITLIPRGVNMQQFAPQDPVPAIREEMNTPDEARIIICVANMVPVKGVELLINAFIELQREFPDWHLWLVGDINNDYGKQLLDLVKNSDFVEFIHFSGKQPNVRDYLDQAEVFVLPTKDEGRREGSPVALLEAMANAKVVVGSAVPGVKDQLRDFPANQFHPGDWKDLQEKLQLILKNSSERNKTLGNTFKLHVEESFTLQHELSRHEAFYLSIFNG